MRKITVALFLTMSSQLWAGEAIFTGQANWRLSQHFANPEPLQHWVTDSPLFSEASLTMTAHLNELESEVSLSANGETQLNRLFVDLSLPVAELTVGLKPQEWGYLFSTDHLNWIGQSPFIMAEHYLFWGSSQYWCEIAGCGLRVSGWSPLFDWQVLAGKFDYWRAGAAVQIPLYQSGLLQLELSAKKDSEQVMLIPFAEQWWQTESQQIDSIQLGVGLQWTLPTQTTLHAEWLWQSHGFNNQDYNRIEQQLESPFAFALADAVDPAFAQYQLMVRATQSYQQLEVENRTVFWNHSSDWFNTTQMRYGINARTEIEAQWETTSRQSLISSIGYGQNWQLELRFSDSW